ncbi:hypothetical protein FWF89_01675 [Candidatus Saccharibacteria bacterium]|nr:hypothetical protein [Candidatus Saccharibacteria bacterium]
MRSCGKVAEKAVNMCGKKLGIVWVVVKKIIQMWCGAVENWYTKIILWEKSGRFYTKNLLNFICGCGSFPYFAQTTITTIDFKKDINKGGMWK